MKYSFTNKKDKKSLKVIKKGFKNNEIVIYAIALMLVAAGYLNYTTNFENTIDTGAEQTIANEEEKESEKIGDARLVSSESEEENIIETNEDEPKEEKEVTEENDYFANTKLERDTNFADIISTYTKILEDNSVSETQKAIAMKEITKINNNKNSVSVCENLLSTKGLENFVVLVNNESINVVVQTEERLTNEKVAQIQNIVSREFDCKIENIHITEKK